MSADNPERAKTFYKKLFNWKFDAAPGSMNYSMIKTNDLTGQKGLGGGMAKRDKTERPGIINYVGVVSVDDTIKRVELLGGKIIQPKQAVPGFGYLATCIDTEDNLFGLFQEEIQTR
ncbi:VOC family protein [Chryseotalea sanaruensis]|uniref:VOC family protein n=2 Tax=Chryseotalea sanaruensis TaxID=2482724 RepID=A0A401U671_9BACT|nr:VOC family protein [Chryseotalea sanaruensis]